MGQVREVEACLESILGQISPAAANISGGGGMVMPAELEVDEVVVATPIRVKATSQGSQLKETIQLSHANQQGQVSQLGQVSQVAETQPDTE